MRTTKMRRDVLKRWLANEDYEPSQDDVAELLADLDEQLENVAAIALAAGLGADATAEDVAARLKAIHATLLTLHASMMEDVDAIARRLAEGHKLAPQPCEDPDRCGMSMRYCDPCARRLAEESGRG